MLVGSLSDDPIETQFLRFRSLRKPLLGDHAIEEFQIQKGKCGQADIDRLTCLAQQTKVDGEKSVDV